MTKQQQLHGHFNKSKLDMITIMRALFAGTIQYVNTKRQPLINSDVIMQSPEIQRYFNQNIDESLKIKEWIAEEKQKMRNNQQSLKGIGKIILNKLRIKLQEIVNKNRETQQSHNKHVDRYREDLNRNINYSGSHGVTHRASGIDTFVVILFYVSRSLDVLYIRNVY